MIESKDEKAQQALVSKLRNFKLFTKAFPGMEKYQLGNEKVQSRTSNSYQPDTYFLTFLINLLLMLAVVLYFFNTRSVS